MKKLLMVMMMVFTTFLFVNCKSSIEETYTVECGLITNYTCNSAKKTISDWSELTHSNFTSLRDYLRYYSISDYSSDVWTYSEIEQFLLSKATPVDEIELLKRNGYNILFFNHAYDNSKKGWMTISRN